MHPSATITNDKGEDLMRVLIGACCIIFFLYPADAIKAQRHPLPDSALIHALKYHVSYLADDSLEGRATASRGEAMAARYIASQFESVGLSPAGTQGTFYQPFDFIAGRRLGENNSLVINGISFQADKDYYPLAYSANAEAAAPLIHAGFGITAPDLGYDDYKKKRGLRGKIFLVNVSTPDGSAPQGRFAGYLDLRPRAERAIAAGAAAVIFFADADTVPEPEALWNKNIFPVAVPVIFLKKHAWGVIKGYKKLSASVSAELMLVEKTGRNVVGAINHSAANTIVIGAHYDHLGYGEEGSLHRGEKVIHNGADDNASGVALMIELARKLHASSLDNNNYLFVAFSGEELGLHGSKKFVELMGSNAASINYMLNFDMVGRLNPTDKVLQVNGYGTSPAWKVIHNIAADSVRLKTSESGIGPSDHTSFYLNNIPVLHLFTGAHEDYHKPTDDAALVNYTGMASVLKICYALIDSLDDEGKIAFTPVPADTSRSTPRFKVTLGVIPDYIFTGKGMRIDGVTEGKPAFKAGMQKGDIIIQLGSHHVSDLTTYMEALSHFKKGDSATVIVIRGEEKHAFNILF